MSKIYLCIMALLVSSCEPANLTDLTPDNGFNSEYGFNTEWSFNTSQFNRAISKDTSSVNVGWHDVDSIVDLTSNNNKVRYISTDTFTFESQDYKVVLDTIQKIANGFNISESNPTKNYRWSNYGKRYISGGTYLIPLKNSKGQRYWIQVFTEQKSFWQTLYTARGIWTTTDPKTKPIVNGDLSYTIENEGSIFTQDVTFVNTKVVVTSKLKNTPENIQRIGNLADQFNKAHSRVDPYGWSYSSKVKGWVKGNEYLKLHTSKKGHWWVHGSGDLIWGEWIIGNQKHYNEDEDVS